MIAKQQKLTTKEVNYLMRRKQSLYIQGYKMLRCDQYANNTYHQTGIQVSGKIHKHAVQRNIIRRAFYVARENHIDKPVENRYYKLFLIIHPEHCEYIATTLTQTTTNIHQSLVHHFSQIIISSLGKLKSPKLIASSPQGQHFGKRSNQNKQPPKNMN